MSARPLGTKVCYWLTNHFEVLEELYKPPCPGHLQEMKVDHLQIVVFNFVLSAPFLSSHKYFAALGFAKYWHPLHELSRMTKLL